MADNKPSVSTYQGAISYGFGPVGRAATAKHGIAKAARNGINPYQEIGRTGLRQWGGYVLEEWLSELQGKRGAETYRQLADDDPVIGGILFAIEMLVRKVTWSVEPATTTNRADVEAQEFLQGVLFEDLENSWSDTVSEVLSFLPYGYHLAEIVYKKRTGDSRDPSQHSKFTDGRIGIAKLATRAQDSLLHWEFDDHDEWVAFVQQPPPTYTTYRIPREKALLFRTKVHKGNPEGRSILRNAVRPAYFLRNIQNIEGIGVERDLAGLPTLKAPPDVDLWNVNDPAMVALLAQAQAFVSQVRRDELEGVVVPTGWEFELLKGGGSRSFNTSDIITRYEQRIATSVLADMILLGQDKVGSYALAGAKKSLFSAAIEAFLDQIGATFNTYLTPRLFRMNGMDKAITDWPKLTHGPVEEVDLETIANMLQSLGAAGAPVFSGDLEDQLLGAIFDKLGLPSPVSDDTSDNE